MKTRVVSALMAVAVASMTASAVTVDKRIPSVKAIRAIASETSVVELPAKAAEIISQASDETREKVAIRTVRIFLQNHHSLAPSLVGAIANAVPELAATVAAEAIKLFPESAYSITKAAVAAAPEQAVRVAIAATSAQEGQVAGIVAGVQRAIPGQVEQFNSLFAALSAGERFESADLAILTVKFRIGTSSGRNPANPNPIFNAPTGGQNQTFAGVTPVFETDPVTNEVIVTFTVDTGNQDVSEDLSGQEALDIFDVISRVLVQEGQFKKQPVIQKYVN